MFEETVVAEERCHRYPRTVEGDDALGLIQGYLADLARFEVKWKSRRR